jgi:hypothetical protein
MKMFLFLLAMLFSFSAFGQNQKASLQTNIVVPVWFGYHAANCSWSRDASSYANFATGDATCTFTEVINRGMGTVASTTASSNNTPGLTLTLPRIGVYEICASANGGTDGGSSKKSFRLVETGGTTVLAEHASTSNTVDANTLHILCGLYDHTSVASRTFTVQGKNSTTGDGNIWINTTNQAVTMAVSWSVKFISK